MRNFIILGATGSIGTQALDIISEDESLNLVAFSFGENIKKAQEIINKFHPQLVCCKKYKDLNILKSLFPMIEFVSGDEGLVKVATYSLGEAVINALVGSVGLRPTYEAIKAKKDILLANKETLVIGGSLIMDLAKKMKVKIYPLDSEHSAIFQLVDSKNQNHIKRLIITASGGALRDKTRQELKTITKEDVLNHPNWKMGEKITVDCSTMMNKGFEVIEAHYLFDVPVENIDVLIHRSSLVHSLVEFDDNSICAQLAAPDMHLPINYAIYNKEHKKSSQISNLPLENFFNLSFTYLDNERYPLVKIAKDALKKGGIYPCVLNATNEVMVKLFLENLISYTDIESTIIEELNNPKYEILNKNELSIDLLEKLDKEIKNDIMLRKVGKLWKYYSEY